MISVDDVKSQKGSGLDAYPQMIISNEDGIYIDAQGNHHRSLLRDIESLSQQPNGTKTGRNYTVFSANDDIRSIFAPHDSVRGALGEDFHI